MENIQIVEPPQIGPYKFRGTVGDGAFSVVKLVKNIENNQYYACKIVPKARLNTIHLEKRFEIEIRIAQQMHHPGIVELCDLLKDDNNYYVIMEFCPNGELFQFIVDRNNLSEDEAKPLFRQILEALQYVHSHGVSHRDLKPENLLIDNLGRIKISDFGLSIFVDSQGLVKTPCGSPCYASPECISGQLYDGMTTDVWSAGVILYAMLTGQLPWKKRNQAQLFKQIKSGDYTIPDELSSDATNMLTRLLTVDPKARITIEEALQHPWLRGCDQQYPTVRQITHYVNIMKVDYFFDRVISNLNLSESQLLTHSSQNLSFNAMSKMLTGSALPKIRQKTSQSHERPTSKDVKKHSSALSRVVSRQPSKKKIISNFPIMRTSMKSIPRANVQKPATRPKKIVV
ncbi:CAMK family protein kinase [Trichomonas vaginalis G3]|uniref:CAMK family protein kinase n=1 Tax=Trichomonas vaginalis (strain ATCC PRA-98 / G3) TaxID=412133 RepID=A2DTF0_TRIV3|nr:protein serine/threonine kinase protein [Trichomonas vaginalis G3]EAY16259.1 CAMK family protein kinase [Trichomonas vaginalis G3]KAI5523398.1 protein serine/threonine kinase protein [Trichomonas vaginalis G3]|eukprot:XP_001328482.1 CAMK family protein kinase [Trichomonas vaginalis G3]